MIDLCPVCKGDCHTSIYRTIAPVYFLVPNDKKICDQDFHELDIHQCKTCGHLFNYAYSTELSERLYGDVPLTNVPVNPSMHKRFHELVDWLPDEAIRNRIIVEIGGGGGQQGIVHADGHGKGRSPARHLRGHFVRNAGSHCGNILLGQQRTHVG